MKHGRKPSIQYLVHMLHGGYFLKVNDLFRWEGITGEKTEVKLKKIKVNVKC